MYVRDATGVLHFHALPTPTPEQLADVARWTQEGLARVCERHGRSLDELGLVLAGRAVFEVVKASAPRWQIDLFLIQQIQA